ncbi:MAG: PKD domain-containing protein [Thermoplasmata archaeon]
MGGVYDNGTGRLYSPENGIGYLTNFNYLLSAAPGTFTLNSSNVTLAGVADSIAYDPSNGFIYLGETNPASGYAQVQAFDPGTGAPAVPVTSPDLGTPGSLVFDSANNLLYLATARFLGSASPTGGLSEFDIATHGFATNGPTLPSGFVPVVLTLTSNDSTLYIGGYDTYGLPSVPLEVLAVNLSSNTVGAIPLPEYAGLDQRPGSIAYDPTDEGLYFASSAAPASGPVTENVTVIDASTNAFVTSIGLPSVGGATTWAAGSLTYDPENAFLYLTQDPSPYFQVQGSIVSNNSTIAVVNGAQLTSGNPSGSLTSSLLPSGGIYVPGARSGAGGELWFPASPKNSSSAAGGFSVLALPPEVTSLSTSPGLIDEGMATTIHATAAWGAGNFTYAYSGLPVGCITQNLTNLTCTPATHGNFSLRLEVTDALGQTANASTPLVVNPPLVVLGSVSTETPDVGQSVQFSATVSGGEAPYLQAWYFGDGAESGSATAVHTYGASGAYAAYILVNDSLGLVKELALPIDVSQVPSGAAIVANRSSTDVGIPVRFSAVVQNGSPPLTESWGFDDGSSNATGPSVAHTFQSVGTFSVTLRITDSNSVSAVSSLLIAVAPDLVGQISASPATLTVNASMTFAERLSGGTGPFVYKWTFDDGTYSSSASPNHEFTAAGNYTVSVRVSDAVGATVVNQTVVHVLGSQASHPAGPAPSNTAITEDGYLLAIGTAVLGAIVGFVVALVLSGRKRPPA